jgi:hypothetical protein
MVLPLYFLGGTEEIHDALRIASFRADVSGVDLTGMKQV